MDEFQRESRYIVLKKTDVKELNTAGLLTITDVEILQKILEKIERIRIINGKQALECVVVESDWPEYEATWKSIEDRVSKGEE